MFADLRRENKMLTEATILLAGFLSPEYIGTTPASMFWLLPLIVSIAVVYKATKVEKIDNILFLKESLMLLGSIFLFMVLIGVVLIILSYLLT
jgi:hypothetical protein